MTQWIEEVIFRVSHIVYVHACMCVCVCVCVVSQCSICIELSYFFESGDPKDCLSAVCGSIFNSTGLVALSIVY